MKKKRLLVRGALAVMAVAAVVAAITGSTSNAATVSDHYVDNLGAGVTAAGFSDGNSNTDCSSATFLAGNYDLWHFVVNQAGGTGNLSWNAGLSTWSSPSSVSVTDVTTQYGNYQPGPNVRHLWIATTPPGATLNVAYLDYTGTATGNENLSHTCARSVVETPTIEVDPTIAYDMTWDWAVDKRADWEVDPMGGYNVYYEVEANRSSIPRLLPGSLHVSDHVLVDPSTTVLTGLTVSFTQGSYTQPCTVNLAELSYDCALDVARVQKNSATGRPTGTATVSAVAAYAGGTLTDSADLDFDDASPGHVYAESATLYDDNATPANAADDWSSTEGYLSYDIDWYPTGSACVERTNTAVLDIIDPPTGMTDPSDAVTVRWCPPLPGKTMGYWGNKMGAPVVTSSITPLRAAYPNVLGGVPTFATNADVRNFFRSANCSGDCWTMFRAQFLATAMNALDGDFADQGVMVMGDCWTVGDMLDAVDASAVGMSKEWYASVKTILDDVNNSRQTTCLTVID